MEFCGRNTLDCFTQAQKLRLSVGTWTSRTTHKVVHRGGANPTLDLFTVVEHRKSKRHTLAIIAQNPAPR